MDTKDSQININNHSPGQQPLYQSEVAHCLEKLQVIFFFKTKTTDKIIKKKKKSKYQPSDYISYQHEVTASMRKILVDWLVDVAEEYYLSSETLFLSVNYIDRFLSKCNYVSKGQLQLLGVGCMFIAS